VLAQGAALQTDADGATRRESCSNKLHCPLHIVFQWLGCSAVLQTDADGATRRESRSNELRVKQMDAASYEERLQQVRR
jgi:hypothetical protein